VTPQQRSRRARIAAHASWAATTDQAARTAPGTAGFCARFERQVDPDGTLSTEQRAEQARHARIAYMLQLAERSAEARRRRPAGPHRPATPQAEPRLDPLADT
jgi:hypothetical protein